MLKRILIIGVATFFVFWPGTLSAQQQPGRMKGRVVDPSGNPAANIDVTVRSVDTGTENTVQTDAQGNFVIAELQPGKDLVQTGNNQATVTPAESTVDPACTTDLSLQTTATGQIAVMAEVVIQPEGIAFLAADPNAQFVTGGPGTFSTLRRVTRLTDTRNIEVALVKRFSILDKAKIEVRGDAYNVINRRNMTGLPVSTLGPGLGFAPSSNFVLLNNPQFGDIRETLSSNPRTVQLALRVIF